MTLKEKRVVRAAMRWYRAQVVWREAMAEPITDQQAFLRIDDRKEKRTRELLEACAQSRRQRGREVWADRKECT